MASESPHSSPFLIAEPTQICSFSRTETGATVFDDRSLRFFREPQLGIDLGAGWDDFYARYRNHKFIGHPRRVDEILEACLRTNDANTKKQLAAADVVTWRGLLSKIVLKNRLVLNVSLINHTLFVEEHDFNPWGVGLQLSVDSYPGYTFEAACTSETPELATQEVGLEPAELGMWMSVAVRDIGSMKFVYAGEVDCVQGGYAGSQDNFLELKTRRGLVENHHWKKWFIQSFLLGTPEILIGFRNDENILVRTEKHQTVEIKESHLRAWDVEAALQEGVNLLTRVKHICQTQKTILGLGAWESKVWRVEVRGRSVDESKVREVSKREMQGIDRKVGKGKREGIVPVRLLEVLKSVIEAGE